MLKVIPVILCGGKGTRLWPLSRQSYPKQFLALYGERKESLLQQTYLRISDLEGLENPIIICNEEHRFLVAEQMRNIQVKPNAIILENEGRQEKSLHKRFPKSEINCKGEWFDFDLMGYLPDNITELLDLDIINTWWSK